MRATKQVPFSIELAKQIQKGEVEGRIVTRDGRPARIICFDREHPTFPILSLISKESTEEIYIHLSNGRLDEEYTTDSDLIIEIPDNEPKFKPFDKVLTRNEGGLWLANLFGYYTNLHNFPYAALGGCWQQCIPYEGNEHLLGGWKNLEKYRPTERPDTAGRCRKKVVAITDDGKFRIFDYIGDAAKWVGGCRENVGRCCRLNQSKKECKQNRRPGQTKGAGRVNTDHKYLGIRFYFFDDPAWWEKAN